jgi:hypothetical protein
MSRESYEKLIEENLRWLLLQPRTLEREHIAEILRVSPAYEYGANADAVHLATSNLSLQRKLKEARAAYDEIRQLHDARAKDVLEIVRAFIHNSVPADPKDDDEITAKGRYSNGTVLRIAAALEEHFR